MYRSTPHSTTGISPAELLYRRMYRTKLPQLSEVRTEGEVKDRDSERKEKGKVYADNRRKACDSNIQKGDTVLLRQEKRNKLSTLFRPNPFTVVQKHGNSVVMEADGVQYWKNVTHVKKHLEQSTGDVTAPSTPLSPKENKISEPQGILVDTSNHRWSEPMNSSPEPANLDIPAGSQTNMDSLPSHGSDVYRRPSRNRKMPAKFKDYVLGFVNQYPTWTIKKNIKQKLGQIRVIFVMLFSVELTQNRYCSNFLFNFHFEEGRNVVFVTLHLFPPLICNDACVQRGKEEVETCCCVFLFWLNPCHQWYLTVCFDPNTVHCENCIFCNCPNQNYLRFRCPGDKLTN